MSHAKNKVTQPDGDSPALCSGGLVGVNDTRKPVPLHKRTGVPLNAEDWTEEDWTDLYRAMKSAIRKISRRHRPNK